MGSFPKKKLAKKIGQNCSRNICSRPASYTLQGNYYCQVHFQKILEELEEQGIEIIFPKYQTPKFPRVKSNFLLNIKTNESPIGGNWAKGTGKQSKKRIRGKVSARKTRKKKEVKKELKKLSKLFAD